ncbi:Transcriptional regulator, AbiEi antitoxin, Type IV TA system [Micromonospora pallida]|uniref:Transcriptional regulator, AbiEi antitoxin, Type IV TA system n=2 Tax=Micromonospora pallida TaxID=145854 RepID=A0A1C6TGB5_9ACTN|nr:Transcriptional regulator, AbiEi antitoxin, Type IV TA system [Micromonospora pallida]
MLRGLAWQRLLPDVYVHRAAHRPDNHRMWCEAVALVLPAGAALAGPSAAYLWGAGLPPGDAPVTVVLPRAARMRPHSRVAVTRSVLAESDLTVHEGLPVTTALRTAFDLGRRPPRTEAVVAVDALLHHRAVDLSALREYATQRAGWPGLPLLREVLSVVEPVAGAPMETRLRLLLLDAGLPTPLVRYDVHDAGGKFVGRVHLAYPGRRVAVEYEPGPPREPDLLRQEATRFHALRAAGWRVVRCTADDVLRHPVRTVRMVAAALRGRPATQVNGLG